MAPLAEYDLAIIRKSERDVSLPNGKAIRIPSPTVRPKSEYITAVNKKKVCVCVCMFVRGVYGSVRDGE